LAPGGICGTGRGDTLAGYSEVLTDWGKTAVADKMRSGLEGKGKKNRRSVCAPVAAIHGCSLGLYFRRKEGKNERGLFLPWRIGMKGLRGERACGGYRWSVLGPTIGRSGRATRSRWKPILKVEIGAQAGPRG